MFDSFNGTRPFLPACFFFPFFVLAVKLLNSFESVKAPEESRWSLGWCRMLEPIVRRAGSKPILRYLLVFFFLVLLSRNERAELVWVAKRRAGNWFRVSTYIVANALICHLCKHFTEIQVSFAPRRLFYVIARYCLEGSNPECLPFSASKLVSTDSSETLAQSPQFLLSSPAQYHILN